MEEKTKMTVQDLIDFLESQDRDAVVCVTDLEDETRTFRSIVMVEAIQNEEFVNENAEFETADNIVLLY